ncbi:MAG: menaquinone-specific isochorismate synthase [Frankiales bacterium]|nr:menaquinone-specific isochorismate synthase [Frankiales bacterium]
MASPASLDLLQVTSVPIEAPSSLLDLLPADGALAWITGSDGLVGWGEAARLELTGDDPFGQAQAWWSALVERSVVDDSVGLPGSGLVAFGSFAFDPAQTSSVLVVPAVLVGRRGGQAWITYVGERPELRPQPAAREPRGVRFADRSRSGLEWMGVVADAVARIETGAVDKVVLARDVEAVADEPVDVRWLLHRLAARYDDCWTFSVDGLVGATPEMLVRLRDGVATSRVLAGTFWPSGDPAKDLRQVDVLARSIKDIEEHGYGLRSVAEALERHCSAIEVPTAPFVLELPNVIHLASDVRGIVSDGSTSIGLIASLHPSAAVCGTPTPVALDIIREIEGLDRGRYAGPVGWLDASGDGEWGIALRCGEVDGSRVRLFAGCGIVSGSDPARELAETNAKLVPMRDALTS